MLAHWQLQLAEGCCKLTHSFCCKALPTATLDSRLWWARSLVLQMLLFMESYMERVKQAEEAEGVRPWHCVPHRCALHSGA